MERYSNTATAPATAKGAKRFEEKYVSPQEYELLLLSRKKLYRTLSFDSAHRGVLDPETGIRIFPGKDNLS